MKALLEMIWADKRCRDPLGFVIWSKDHGKMAIPTTSGVKLFYLTPHKLTYHTVTKWDKRRKCLVSKRRTQ